MKNKETQTSPESTWASNPKLQHFTPEGCICAKDISFVVDKGSIDYVNFGGGCEGNHKAIANMIEGMSVDFVIDRFSGITCGSKSTSCVDQLCTALSRHMQKEQSN